ncbi:MAG: outer membrane beta-barrel protein [Rhizobacter sp.]
MGDPSARLGLLVTRPQWPAACALLCLFSGLAQAADDRGLHGAVGLSAQHDDNLFRLPDGVAPAAAGVSRDADDDGSHRGDLTLSPFVSLDASLAFGRQHFGLAGTRRETHLQRYSAYDTQTGDLRARWDWQLANDFDGRIDAGTSDQASDLQDFLGSRRNVLTVRNEHASANWRPRPDRRITLDAQRYRGHNDLPERATSDYEVRTLGVEGGWLTSLGNEWTLRWRSTQGRYPNRSIVALTPIDNSYHQHDSDIGLVLRPGGRTRADIRVGYAVRQHEQVPQRDFEGPSGRAAITWQASGALSLDLEAVRDLSALDDYDRLFAISTHYALGAQLIVAAQWQASLRWSEQHIDFGGDPQNIITQAFGQSPARRDRVQSTRLAVTWLPTPRIQVEMSLEHSARSSSRPGLDFSNGSAGVSTQYSF